ncbi:hypothetical protein [Streptomyces sp. NPDC056296]|uniref:hypothetical protein n=1 Tax=Streptomyces sp. NPDC056296 TaxID=3345775 RepID=UPI0035D7B5B5
MSGELYGLIGAVGGALVAGVLAYVTQRRGQRHAARLAKAEEATVRIVRIRTTVRAWYEFLDHTAQDLRLERPVDALAFGETASRLASEVQEALDSLARDGIWFRQGRYTAGTDGEPEGITELLASATRRLKEALAPGPPSWADAEAEVLELLGHVQLERAGLSTLLMDLIESYTEERVRVVRGLQPSAVRGASFRRRRRP